ncbi:hypothetical protein [Rhodovibrio salinarum]|uniref:Uncharacterized protein n=1 Tax=Rhodovibrio salinarum TaxID=1087 RepID=A0A934V0G6_9PROT|nr:hypothetical protein [Rhodovibrio salinarum]MBK1698187.1 hypothetical protein [Rhodovibrio salinarum]
MTRKAHMSETFVSRQPTPVEIARHIRRGRQQRAIFVAFMLRRGLKHLSRAVDGLVHGLTRRIARRPQIARTGH